MNTTLFILQGDQGSLISVSGSVCDDNVVTDTDFYIHALPESSPDHYGDVICAAGDDLISQCFDGGMVEGAQFMATVTHDGLLIVDRAVHIDSVDYSELFTVVFVTTVEGV